MEKGHKHTCPGGLCFKCWGVKLLVVGLLILGNTYWSWFSNWAYFWGWLLVVLGLIKLVSPTCSHCK